MDIKSNHAVKAALTVEVMEWVIASFLLSHKEAIAVQEVRPGHLDGLEGVDAALACGLADAPAWLQHLLGLTAWRQHGAAEHACLLVALAAQHEMCA